MSEKPKRYATELLLQIQRLSSFRSKYGCTERSKWGNEPFFWNPGFGGVVLNHESETVP